MEFTPIDQSIRDEIEHNLEQNLCVEASAGTGKTTVLVARIVEILRTGRATVDQLAVITFTEKAAAELSARVRERLEEALTECNDGDQTDRIKQALRDLNRARIETIHAFASSLLRERPVEAGLDPNFEILDDLGMSLRFDEAYRRWLGEILSQPSDELWRAFNRGVELSHLRTVAEMLHANRAQLPSPAIVHPIHSSPDELAELSLLVDDLTELLSQCRDPNDRGAIQINKILDLFDEYRTYADQPAILERVMLKPVKITAAGNKSKWEAGACDQQKAICKDLKQQIEAYQEALRTDALVGILPLIQRFVQDYSEQRRSAGTAEFDDLLIWTRNLLRDQPEVRRYFQQNFDCILVDEFQDTDPLQVEIVLYLTADSQEETEWRRLKPQRGKLFVVGDPKQSIYRFRRADITIYEWVKNQVLADGLRSIKQNFRSVEGVIAWVNDVFSQVIQPLEGIQPDYHELVSARPNHNGGQAPVVLALGAAAGADAVRQEEARLLAGMIDRLVHEERWPVNENDHDRPATWRDVAILLPTRTGIEHYERALAERDIPYRHEGGRSFFDRQEVRELISCLKAIDDPTDRLSLVAALRSGAFGCSDEDLAQFVYGRGLLDIREEPSVDVPSVTDALNVLQSLRALRGKVTLPELVGRVLEDTRLVEYAITLPQGQQVAANLLKVADQARAFSGVHGGGLRAFVRWLTTSSGGRGDEADAAVAEARDDVVRILTIHSAKGLEFPIVALANLNSAGRSSTTTAIPGSEPGQLELRVGTQTLNFKTPGFDEASAREDLHEDSEKRRLLYVAATRARDYLILPAVLDGDKTKGMLAALSPCLPLDPSGTDPNHHESSIHLYDTALISRESPPAPSPDPVLPAEVDEQERRRDNWLESHGALLEHAARGLPLVVLDDPDTWDDFHDEHEEALTVRHATDAAEARELALHHVMARVDLIDGRNLATLSGRVAESMALLGGPDELVALARNCLASPVLDRARAGSGVQRNVTFSLRLADRFVEGQIDLLFQEEDKLILVDFKSDQVTPVEIDAHGALYRAQAAAHAFSVETATSLPVQEVCQVFGHCGDERRYVVNDELRSLGQAQTQLRKR